MGYTNIHSKEIGGVLGELFQYVIEETPQIAYAVPVREEGLTYRQVLAERVEEELLEEEADTLNKMGAGAKKKALLK